MYVYIMIYIGVMYVVPTIAVVSEFGPWRSGRSYANIPTKPQYNPNDLRIVVVHLNKFKLELRDHPNCIHEMFYASHLIPDPN